jgi:HAD superfamily hydrolase (TIGR01662 family)
MPSPVREIVVVAGPPAGGKSTFVEPFVKMGYVRVNRDEVGGSLKPGGRSYTLIREAFDQGTVSFVLDNIYATREDRAVVLMLGRDLGLPVRLIWLETDQGQAQFFAARRQFQRYGRVFSEADYKAHRNDPNMFPPAAQFAYWKRVERPDPTEGFSVVEFHPVEIRLGPEYQNKAVILDYDGTLRVTKSGRHYPSDPADIEILPNRATVLRQFVQQGFMLLGASNQSGISRKPGDEKYVSEADAVRCFEATNRLLGFAIPVLFAPDSAGVPKTYWRKPCPGVGVTLIETYKLNPAACIMVGDRWEDRGFADRCGFQYHDAEDFFR